MEPVLSPKLKLQNAGKKSNSQPQRSKSHQNINCQLEAVGLRTKSWQIHMECLVLMTSGPHAFASKTHRGL
jgi:hypothetical protein